MNKFYTKEEMQKLIELPENKSNELLQMAFNYNTTKLYDPEAFRYLKHYWRIFKDIRYNNLNILEIGVKEGQSLLLWKEFFPNAKIYGIEINPAPLSEFKHDRIEKIFFGDQADAEFLNKVADEIGEMDIIIDDGGHTMVQQQTSFEILFPKTLKNDGLYIIEDAGTSYWLDWGGGLKNEKSTIEYVKNLVDNINYRAYRGGRKTYIGLPPYEQIGATYLDENVESVEFCMYLCFIRKGNNFSI